MSENAPSPASDVPRAPAPWTLTGDAYIVMLQLPEQLRRERSFIPDALRGRFEGRNSLLMLIDYRSSNVGPYRELLFIPARFRTRYGLAWSITKIYVSSRASVVNGQLNWGIPKEHADFEIQREADESERFLVSQGGEVFADLKFKAAGPSLPSTAALVPASLRTLVHCREGQEYFCTPRGRGRVRYARMLSARVDERRVPPVSEGRVLFAARFSDFTIDFPPARLEEAER
jgi:hypothetical protein